jgi:hypothetical protein
MGNRAPRYRGLPFRSEDGRSAEEVLQRKLFVLIEDAIGGPLQGLVRREAWRVSGLGVDEQAASRALAVARHRREHGKGRRPSARLLERLARRAALANSTYTSNLERLRGLAQALGRNGHRTAPEVLLDQAHQALREAAHG